MKSVSELMFGLRNNGQPIRRRIKIHTIRYGVHKYALEHGLIVLDARIGAGLPLLKPSNNLMQAMRDTGKDWEWLLDRYMEQLEESYAANPIPWLEILQCRQVAVACEAGADDQMATRMILRAFLSNIAYRNDMEVIHGGEVHVNTSKKEVFML